MLSLVSCLIVPEFGDCFNIFYLFFIMFLMFFCCFALYAMDFIYNFFKLCLFLFTVQHFGHLVVCKMCLINKVDWINYKDEASSSCVANFL